MTKADFPEWLEKELRRRDWRPIDLAKQSGLDTGLISRVLAGARYPTADTLIAIARGLNLPHDLVLQAGGVPIPARKERPLVRRVLHLLDQLDDESLEVEERRLRAEIELKEERERERNATNRGRRTATS